MDYGQSPEQLVLKRDIEVLETEARALCSEIEALTACAQQTKVSLKASDLRQKLTTLFATTDITSRRIKRMP